MNVFEAFQELISRLENTGIRYALVGGVALAFHTQARFTRDIDLLVHSDDFDQIHKFLLNEGYFESAEPWTFSNVAIELHRFLKPAPPDDQMMIDILVANDDCVAKIIDDALEAESDQGSVRVANKEALIWLKRTRNSKQDQADIESLENE
jgi:hypothetical protein